MTCFRPLDCWQPIKGGQVEFYDNGGRYLQIACGQCRGCRRVRAREWAIRLMHEQQTCQASAFLTLTYEHDYVPSLGYEDFQKFMKRLRRRYSDCRIRFFAVGEYGAELGRPHFHSLIFASALESDREAVLFSDRKRHSKDLFRSDELSRLWPHGFGSIGDVTFQSAAYCARYCVDKVTGEPAADHYRRVDLDSGELVDVVPEFARMSLRPAIGVPWLQRFWRDVFNARDGVVIEGKELPTPRFYDRWIYGLHCSLSWLFPIPKRVYEIEFDRHERVESYAWDTTPERLAVREQVENARFAQLVRTLT